MESARHDLIERKTLDLWPDTARILGLSKTKIYEAAHKGEIPAFRVGRRWLVSSAALDRFLENSGQAEA